MGGKRKSLSLLPVLLPPVPPLTCLCHPDTQDESNRSGGKWIIRLRKGLASRFWENIILAMLGEQFMVGEEICGAVVSIRFQVRPRTERERESPHSLTVIVHWCCSWSRIKSCQELSWRPLIAATLCFRKTLDDDFKLF